MDIGNIVYLVALIACASAMWGIILNGLRTTFTSLQAFSILSWRFWMYGGIAWIGMAIASTLFEIY